MSWITDLDACASAGIIEFDAPAYIKGAAPRYYGNPPFETITGELPPIKAQPKKDEFKKSGDPAFNNPTWKKVLFGALAIGAAVFGLSKIKNIKNIFSFSGLKTLPSKIWNGIKTLPAKIWNGIKKGWNALTGLFKKSTPTPTPTPTP